ncbi:hypothetical protein [uncultured Cohaesibacter sp.]|uniref:hypothetical protein n=1 Tax=uncultured Cohaesibacter sp. TaxID=1002546 RepID=UPI002AAB869E|nr:hypothetical protein [uncultured Cohaesibacter sp.]
MTSETTSGEVVSNQEDLRFRSLLWSARDGVRLKNWSLSGKGSLRIDLEVTGSHELGDLVAQLRSIEAAQTKSKPPKPKR